MHNVTAALYRVPTDRPEADGTLDWDQTTMLLVQVEASGGARGLGFSFTGPGADVLVRDQLAPAIAQLDEDDIGTCWTAMVKQVRNTGRSGLAATAISAVDVALWDLRAKRRGVPLFRLLPTYRSSVPVYGSGGFTSYTLQQVIDQLSGWVKDDGMRRVKMKIGTRVETDVDRILAVREAIGSDARLMLDANGRYSAKEAITLALRVAEETEYFEEPVSSDDLEQMALVRRSVTQQVAAGEYGYDPWYFERMLRAQAVDILQADATRCLGITGFVMAGHLAYAAQVGFSAHTAPSIHAHAGCGVPQLCHVEYFHDHARLEDLLFEGVLRPERGELRPDSGRPGLGIALKAGAEDYRAG